MHCGEMGSRWGFNRTIGQMVGLLIIHENALTGAQISEALKISRGNVSMGIKELQSWRLIQVQHKPNDRKEYYRPAGSIWELAIRVFEERRKRAKSVFAQACQGFCKLVNSGRIIRIQPWTWERIPITV